MSGAPVMLRIPTEEEFINAVSQIMRSYNAPRDDIYFRMLSTPLILEFQLNDNEAGTIRYNGDDLTEIRKRFKLLLHYLELMINLKFSIQRLEIAQRSGLSGAKIIFLTPSNRKFEHNYFRSGDTVDLLIPDDFLHDLKNFPALHG